MVDSDTDAGASEGRWREAQRVLDGVADDGARERWRRQKVIRLITILCVMGFAVGVVSALIGNRSGHHPQAPVDVPVWREVVGGALLVIGLVVAVVKVVRLMRSGGLWSAWCAPTRVLSRVERKRLLQQVRGRRPVVPAQLPLARDLAVRLTRQRLDPVMTLGVAMIMAAPLFNGYGIRTESIIGISLMAVSYGAGAVLMPREITRARLFLAQHPEPNPPARPGRPRTRRPTSNSGIEEHQRRIVRQALPANADAPTCFPKSDRTQVELR